MSSPNLIPCLLFIFVAGGCVSVPRSYYMGPFDATSAPYRATPTAASGVKAATYVSGAATLGSQNYHGRDNQRSFFGSVYHVRRFGAWQAWLGGSGTLGAFHVGYYDGIYASSFSRSRPDTVLRVSSDKLTYGSAGFFGGVHYALVPNRRHEIRFGAETAYGREFGDYLNFRRKLSDSTTNVLYTGSRAWVLGTSIEFVTTTRHHSELGYRIALGTSLVRPSQYLRDSASPHPYYFSNSIYLGKDPATCFFQLNIGHRMASIQAGVCFRLNAFADRRR